MQTYSILREFADSWMLLLLFIVFAGMLIWVFRPGSRRLHADTASIPFRNTENPATGRTGAAAAKTPESDT